MSLKGKIKSNPFNSHGKKIKRKKEKNSLKCKEGSCEEQGGFRLQMHCGEGAVESHRGSFLSTDETTDEDLGALSSVAAELEWSCSSGRNNTNYTNVYL